jgi:hypothetical protein
MDLRAPEQASQAKVQSEKQFEPMPMALGPDPIKKLRERHLQVTMPDVVFYMHADRRLAKSDLLYKTLLKIKGG